MQSPFIRFVAPSHNLEIFGIRLLGVDAQNGRKLLASFVFVGLLYLAGKGLSKLSHFTSGDAKDRVAFWSRQAIIAVSQSRQESGLHPGPMRSLVYLKSW